MEARSAMLLLAIVTTFYNSNPSIAEAQHARPGRMVGSARATASTQNFTVFASEQSTADTIAKAAEAFREDLAIHWLGQPIPNWPEKCPITVTTGETLGAGGATTFTLSGGTVGRWSMNVQGSLTRVLDSVLPHEVTHTILATHFAPLGKPVPRWADEGACTTVEHVEERSKHDHYLIQFLSQGRGLPFATMFTLKEYPADIMPLYAQGYSVSMFLIAQGGPQKFVKFLERGMQTEDWVTALEQQYQYPRVGKLQTAWNQWVGDGGGQVNNYTAATLGMGRSAIAANTPDNTQSNTAAFDSQVELAAANVPAGRTAVLASRGYVNSDGFEPARFPANEPVANRAVSAMNAGTASVAMADPPSFSSQSFGGQSNAQILDLANGATDGQGDGSWYHRQMQGNAAAAAPTFVAALPADFPQFPAASNSDSQQQLADAPAPKFNSNSYQSGMSQRMGDSVPLIR